MYTTDNIGLACYLMIKDVSLVEVKVKSKGRAFFTFDISPETALTYENTYTTSEHARFFSVFKHLRSRALRGG